MCSRFCKGRVPISIWALNSWVRLMGAVPPAPPGRSDLQVPVGGDHLHSPARVIFARHSKSFPSLCQSMLIISMVWLGSFRNWYSCDCMVIVIPCRCCKDRLSCCLAIAKFVCFDGLSESFNSSLAPSTYKKKKRKKEGQRSQHR